MGEPIDITITDEVLAELRTVASEIRDHIAKVKGTCDCGVLKAKAAMAAAVDALDSECIHAEECAHHTLVALEEKAQHINSILYSLGRKL